MSATPISPHLAETFQAPLVPGCRAHFETMLDAPPRVELHPRVEFKEAGARWRHMHLVFTGAVDASCDHRFGALQGRIFFRRAIDGSPLTGATT